MGNVPSRDITAGDRHSMGGTGDRSADRDTTHDRKRTKSNTCNPDAERCPICCKAMGKSPYQCCNGHVICRTCMTNATRSSRTKACPQCGVAVDTCNPYSQLKECANGCGHRMRPIAIDVVQHEKCECRLRPISYYCPECTYNDEHDTLESLMHHLATDHGVNADDFAEISDGGSSWTYPSSGDARLFLRYCNMYFCMTIERRGFGESEEKLTVWKFVLLHDMIDVPTVTLTVSGDQLGGPKYIYEGQPTRPCSQLHPLMEVGASHVVDEENRAFVCVKVQ
eukprot:TRINITY_DN108139_c0_g1_i1.p1 TRINITY_DN108139_c0_g1~~TRINITY_DN108139_c0_g1_i1.p1  ORF type:complete len:281 (+),score=-2.08 TRINITY_DN108139_c0_g1_i1:49-891(+)